jgi:hypothetical protein
MYVNAEKVGQSYLPLERPGTNAMAGEKGSWIAKSTLQQVTTISAVTGASQTQTAAMAMVGCHRNSDDLNFRDFAYPNTIFDELAIFDHRLTVNRSVNEILFFTGGSG